MTTQVPATGYAFVWFDERGAYVDWAPVPGTSPYAVARRFHLIPDGFVSSGGGLPVFRLRGNEEDIRAFDRAVAAEVAQFPAQR